MRIIGNQLRDERYRYGILLDFSIEKLRIYGIRVTCTGVGHGVCTHFLSPET